MEPPSRVLDLAVLPEELRDRGQDERVARVLLERVGALGLLAGAGRHADHLREEHPARWALLEGDGGRDGRAYRIWVVRPPTGGVRRGVGYKSGGVGWEAGTLSRAELSG